VAAVVPPQALRMSVRMMVRLKNNAIFFIFLLLERIWIFNGTIKCYP
jgi:hypothetical protein